MAGATLKTGATNALWISHRLQILELPDSPAYGQWIQIPDLSPDWFRRLDAAAAAWISGSLSAAIRSGRMADRSDEALRLLDAVLQVGRDCGQLPAGPLPPSDLSVSWYTDCPRELVDCHTEGSFPPGPPPKRRETQNPRRPLLQSARTAGRDAVR